MQRARRDQNSIGFTESEFRSFEQFICKFFCLYEYKVNNYTEIPKF